MKVLVAILFAVLLVHSSNANVIKCFGECAKKHLTVWEALRIIGTCTNNKECYLGELKGKALECAQECLSLSASENEHFAQELLKEALNEKNPLKCFGECAKKHLTVWEALRVIGTCKDNKDCYLKELKGKALECAQECLSVDSVEEQLEKMVDNEGDKNLLKCFGDCAKKHLSLYEALRIIGTCKTEKSCYLKELKGKALECAQQCLGLSAVKEEPSCEDAVKEVRKKFSELNREGKRELVEKVFKKLQEKYPDAEKTKIFAFVRALFSPLSPTSVCKLYDRLFKKSDNVETIVDEYEKGLGSCLKSCVKKHLKWTTALKLIAKCKINKACYIASLGGKALECVKSCI